MPILFLLISVVLFGIAAAEENLPTEEEAAATVTRGLLSPRETMKTFLTAMREVEEGDPASYSKAQSALNLEAISALVRADMAPDIAWMLYEVLNRSGEVRLNRIPLKTKEDIFVYRHFERGDIAMELRPDGRWLFSSDTVQSLPSILDELPDPSLKQEAETVTQSHLPWHVRIRSHLPEQFKSRWIFLENWQWIGIAVVSMLGSLSDRIVSRLLKAFVRFWRKRGHMAELWLLPDDWLRPLGLPVMAGVWWLGVNSLGLNPGALLVLLVAAKLLAALAGIWSAYRLVDFSSAYLQNKARRTRNKLDDVLVPLFRKSLKVVITLVGILFIASNLNLNIAGLIAGVGLGGLAFALAAKDMVQNLFGSITVLLDQSFHVGDWVVIGDVEGTVEEVGLRSTRIRTFYNSELILPNSTLITASIDNMGKRKYRRFKCNFSVTYETPPHKVEIFCEAIRELIRRHPHLRKDCFHVYLHDLAASSLDILVYVFFEVPDWGTELRERHRFLIDVLRVAESLEIQFAYPTQTIHWNSGAEPDVPGERGSEDMDQDAIIGHAHRAARAILGQAIDRNENPRTEKN